MCEILFPIQAFVMLYLRRGTQKPPLLLRAIGATHHKKALYSDLFFETLKVSFFQGQYWVCQFQLLPKDMCRSESCKFCGFCGSISGRGLLSVDCELFEDGWNQALFIVSASAPS